MSAAAPAPAPERSDAHRRDQSQLRLVAPGAERDEQATETEELAAATTKLLRDKVVDVIMSLPGRYGLTNNAVVAILAANDDLLGSEVSSPKSTAQRIGSMSDCIAAYCHALLPYLAQLSQRVDFGRTTVLVAQIDKIGRRLDYRCTQILQDVGH